MKTTDTTFRTHLDGDVTALCTCWKITRRDGEVLYFTDSDQDVVRGAETYLSIGAYSRSAIENTSNLSVDNLEVSGMATELSLPVEELRAGAFDHAEVAVFLTSWLPNVGGQLKLRRGFFGEVTVLPNGTFTVELRGVLQRLAHTFTDVYSATCRHDLGDTGCGIDITHPYVTEGAHIPVPFLDPNFEEVGINGLGSSFTWYNPINDEELVDATTTYSGVYAAHGSELGGWMQQDISLYQMSDDFRTHVDEKKVDMNAFGWRRDDGDEGRISFEFLDDNMRELRETCGHAVLPDGIAIPEARVVGEWTVEAWVRFDSDPSTAARDGGVFNYGVLGSPEIQSLYVDGVNDELRYYIRTGNTNFASISFPFAPARNQWVHLAVVSKADVISVFIDGVEQDQTINFTGDLYVTDIGRGWYGGSNIGVDEFRIWNVARSQAEISEYRYTDLANGITELERYYPFDGDGVDYGTNNTAAISPAISFDLTPVRVGVRGTETTVTTGFADVGTAWVMSELEGMNIPPHTRTVRMIFDHRSVAGTSLGTRLDGVFGWFRDADNSVLMPNFNVGADEAVWTRAGMVNISASNRVFSATIDEPRGVHDGWFQGGLITFHSGDNAGGSMEVKTWTASSNRVELFLSMPYPVKQGDLFTIYPGCDKSRVGCRALFNNVANFFGTPDVPGEDELYRYPDAN